MFGDECRVNERECEKKKKKYTTNSQIHEKNAHLLSETLKVKKDVFVYWRSYVTYREIDWMN